MVYGVRMTLGAVVRVAVMLAQAATVLQENLVAETAVVGAEVPMSAATVERQAVAVEPQVRLLLAELERVAK